jgi:hypothetical protein
LLYFALRLSQQANSLYFFSIQDTKKHHRYLRPKKKHVLSSR